jgi:hypothetical protein
LSNLGFGTGTLGQVAPNYGSDLSCVFDLDPAMAEISGRLLLAQACARRIITPRGGLIDDPNYGYDITQFLNDDLSPSDLARIASGIDGELVKDERVFASSTTVNFALNTLTIATTMTPSAGPTFALVLAVSNVTVAILQPIQ